MSLFDYSDDDAFGKVRSVDTATVVVGVEQVEKLRRLQVNRLVVLQSSKAGQHLIGIVQKITRTSKEEAASSYIISIGNEEAAPIPENNQVKVTLIGTYIAKFKGGNDIFRRTLETVPEIDANCFSLEGDKLTSFMRIISQVSSTDKPTLSIGKYTLDEDAEAFVNGNKLFQRHAVIVGSTGSGKSWANAHLLEQISYLPNANAILFDLHGEYGTLSNDGISHFKVAGPSDIESGKNIDDGILYLPYWLLNYEDMVAMVLDRSDENAPNQAMLLSRAVVEEKKKYLNEAKHLEVLNNFTIDSPVYYSLPNVISRLEHDNTEMVEGAKGQKQGPFHGKLTRFITRLNNKISDRRYGFMFEDIEAHKDYDWLPNITKKLLAGSKAQADSKGGVKIINFSEVPSDILPIVISLIARLIFSVQQWTPSENRHPVSLFCDEAHLYIPNKADTDSTGATALKTFDRIAKEGRKYGIGLVVISQRPSEVSKTVLSQCNNVIAMRLTNAEDQTVVRRLLPDSLGGFGDILPILDIGEAILVGDASLLPSRVRVGEPTQKPESKSVDFWDKWSEDKINEKIAEAVQSLRMQSQGIAVGAKE